MQTLVIAGNNNEFQLWRQQNPRVDKPIFVNDVTKLSGYDCTTSRLVYTGSWFYREDRFELEADIEGRYERNVA